MPHAILNEAGVVVTLFHDAPPESAIEVPAGVVCGWRQVDGKFVAPEVHIEELKERAIERINQAYARLAVKTLGVPYGAKHDEALEVSRMADDGDDPSGLPIEQQHIMFPRLSASVGIEADNLTDAAALILNRYTEDAKREGLLERARLIGKNRVKIAGSSAEIDAASKETIQALEAVYGTGGLAKETRTADGNDEP
jgi:hypothetical protein